MKTYICLDCEKQNACGKRYLEGNQTNCKEREKAYKSHENYIRWLAKSGDFNELHNKFNT
jgi:hypothetical protein